ncbi:MAG TPA: Hsp70 family protein [Syntrophales bacterium]|jgi:molecular chaperone DnaK|nr:Hsp70 family protein [Syntrophales bacterium]HON22995.1 Hsp70 family protein [Syntrophales bacterium]HOU78056.1 Hsp70 family protein [Syntrophales bacterium]HPC32568.1 Hsp70 family protein [Syntrophales bacterium]HQG34062.1 Hsp70 family protein [Syntrophales bacterium]
METIVGIDLGTTNSEIALLRTEGRPEIIPVDGEPIMPSCVSVDAEGRLLVGRPARNRMISHPEQTILSVKREMGKQLRIPLGDKSYLPEEISAFILAKLKAAAEQYLGQPVSKAVITVPAYFDDAQRTATREAGVLAGLEVVRIINEPTAAALAYEAGHEQNQRILVYDLGGGTFDASIVVMEGGVVEVKASHGDTRLGGDDFDRLLTEHVARNFRKRHGVDLLRDLRAANRLRVAVEKAKCILSDQPFATIREEYIWENLHLDMEISREEYEEMIRPLIRRTMDSVHACLNDALYLPKAIDKIILAGGATRTPLVARMLAEDMGREPRHEINPDLIVAMGAAIQGAASGGMKTGAILVDITPYTFGTRAIGEHNGMPTDNLFVPVIKRNSPLPVSKEEIFYTQYDNQDKVLVEIYQGESPRADENIFIGNFWVRGLSKAPASNPILLKLELDVNGILQVTAREKVSGLSRKVTMDITRKGEIHEFDGFGEDPEAAVFEAGDDDEGEDFLKEIGKPGGKTPTPYERQQLLDQAKSLRKRAEKLLPAAGEEDAGELKDLLEKSRRAISVQDWQSVSELNESIADLLFYLED